MSPMPYFLFKPAISSTTPASTVTSRLVVGSSSSSSAGRPSSAMAITALAERGERKRQVRRDRDPATIRPMLGDRGQEVACRGVVETSRGFVEEPKRRG